MSSETTWPAGVIARYLTVGGATVDITLDIYDDDRYVDATSTCTGCKDWERQHQKRTASQTSEDARRRAEKDATEWAQEHAEHCRAMPRT
ncbi:hypothetical protein ACLQ2R_17070 [Streptosporangium sp. DT93]|uniref:hypothetical protein n=1 Tax=Streptosporangium sp. DT93 TaxID=3393428 RepID=UPI003CE8A61C